MKFIASPDKHLISLEDISSTASGVYEYIDKLQTVMNDNEYSSPESLINLCSDTSIYQQIQDQKACLDTRSLKYVIVVGNGGSILGAKALYNAIHGFYDVLQRNRYPKMVFISSVSSKVISALNDIITTQITSPSEILIVGISKSGTTLETIYNLELLQSYLPEKFQRYVFIGAKDTEFHKKALAHNIPFLEIPLGVSGRFGVFSASGLFPLHLIEMDVLAFKNGAISMRDRCLTKDLNNPALVSACILFLSMKKNLPIYDNFHFAPCLESLGKWYRQLTAESLGKEGRGITPTVSIGTDDLHSMFQLNLEGPRDKFTSFIKMDTKVSELFPNSTDFCTLENCLTDKSTAQVNNAIYSAIVSVYQQHQLPFVEVAMDDINEKEIGEYMQFRMIETMFLARLMEINAFDQPAIESYKTRVKEILNT